MSFFLAYGATAMESLRDNHSPDSTPTNWNNGNSLSSVVHCDSVLTSLKRNDLISLRLGWHDSCILPSNRALAKALRRNTSLRFISIGWHLQSQHKGREVLFQLLVTLAESIRPQQLQGIQLILNDSVPANVLQKFLQSQICLSSIDIQVVKVHTSSWKGLHNLPNKGSDSLRSNDSGDTQITTTSSRSNSSNNSRSSEKNSWKSLSCRKKKVANFDHLTGQKETKAKTTTVVPVLLDTLLNHHQFDVLSELRLVDCDLTDETALMLAQDLIPTSFLSLRGNRRLSGYGAGALIRQLKGTRRLDLSLCDFCLTDCALIARAFRDRMETSNNTFKMQEFRFCANYRMELGGLAELMQVVPLVVHSLDLSYCELSEAMTIHILRRLTDLGRQQLAHEQHLPHVSTTASVYRPVQLRELIMHGCRPSSADATRALVALLRQNAPPLRLLAINDDKNDKKYMSAAQLHQIADAMAQNYEMEHLNVDFFKGSVYEEQAWKEVEYWQRLNRAGRRLLLVSRSTDEISNKMALVPGRAVDMRKAMRLDMDEWIDLLSNVKAKADLDSIYWVVRNSVERFRR